MKSSLQKSISDYGLQCMKDMDQYLLEVKHYLRVVVWHNSVFRARGALANRFNPQGINVIIFTVLAAFIYTIKKGLAPF